MKLFVRLLGLGIFTVLFIFSILFYKERTLTFDLAFQDFFLILNKTFVVNLRFGSVIPEIFPLLFRWFNCPLKQILLAHSVGFVVYYLFFFLAITFFLNKQKAAIVLLLFLLLVVNDTFYWIQSELPQGLAFLILYYAWLEKAKPSQIRSHPVLHFFFLLFIQFFHPLMIAPVLFVLLYSLYKQSQWDLSLYVKPVLIAFICFCIRFVAGKFDAYENSKLNLPGLMLVNLPHLFSLPSTQKLLHFALTDYLLYWLLLIITLIILVTQKRMFIAILLSVFTMAYFILICTTNPNADKFYLENMLLPVSIFLLLPFTDFVWRKFFTIQPAIAVAFIFIIVAIRLCFIYNTHSIYSNRLSWYNSMFRIMDKNNSQRMMVDSKNAPLDTLIMTWYSGYESLLLSSLADPDKSKSLIVDDDLLQFTPYLQNDTLLLAKWGVWPTRIIPKEYFNLKPGRYMVKDKP